MNQVRRNHTKNTRAFKVEFFGEVFEIAPELHVGLIAASRIANLEKDAEVNALLAHMEQEVLNSGLQKDTVSEIPEIREFSIRSAGGDELFLPIGKVDEYEIASAGEIIYADASGRAYSRRWNWRQSDHIKTTAESSQMLFTIEAVHKDAKALVEATTHLLHELLRPFTDTGSMEWAFIHKDASSHTFQLHTGGIADRAGYHETIQEGNY